MSVKPMSHPSKRQEQTGRFLPRRDTEDTPLDHTIGTVIGPAPPDLSHGTDLEGTVDQAILEILDLHEIGDASAVCDRNAHGGGVPVAQATF